MFRLTCLPGIALLLAACAPLASADTPATALAPPEPPHVRPLPQTIRLRQEANGSVADLRVGDTLELNLPGNPSTGYAWSPTRPRGPGVEPLGAPGFRPSSAGMGGGGDVILRYRAVSPGQFPLSLTYRRSFEAPPPTAQTFEVLLSVR